MLKNLLAVADALAQQTLIVTLRLEPNETRASRSVMLALGEEGQPPTFVVGDLNELPSLLNRAYDQYSRQRKEVADKAEMETEIAAPQLLTQAPAESKPTKPKSSLSIF